MEYIGAIGLFLFVLFLLLGTGVWVGLALMGVAWVGMEVFTSRPAGDAMITTVWTASSSWTLTALPLFIWMGEILYRTRLSAELFKGLAPWMAPLPGGLLHTNVAGCTVFAAVSGSSVATLTTVGKMSLPELAARGYPERMTIGSLAGAATLGLLIPPSLILIVYGVSINESITKLFLAGILPGLVLAVMFMAYVAIWSRVRRDLMPPPEPPTSLGIATATEAAAFGVVGSLVLATAQRTLTWRNFADSLMGATRTSAMIALILAGAAFLSLSMGFTGLPRALAAWIGELGLSRVELLLALLVFYIILGCFLDGISAVVLTMAVIEPMIRAAGIDPIWFGVFIVVVVEMAQITPPVGFNLFVLQGMTGRSIGYIAYAALPMFMIMVLMVFILIAWPELATWLPQRMSVRAG